MTALVTLAAALSEEFRVLFFSPLLLIFFIASYTFEGSDWGKDQTSFTINDSNPLANVTALEVYAFTGIIILLCWLIIFYFLWYRRE